MNQPAGEDARIMEISDGLQIMRDHRIRYYRYSNMTPKQYDRFARILTRSLTLASNESIHFWRNQRKKKGPSHDE